MDPMGYICVYIYTYHEPPKPTCLDVFMKKFSWVFSWPKFLDFSMGSWGLMVFTYTYIYISPYKTNKKTMASYQRLLPWTFQNTIPDATGHCAMPCDFHRTPTARVPRGCVVYKVMIAIPGPSWEWWHTLPETNIAPENGWLEYYFPFGMAYFQVPC